LKGRICANHNMNNPNNPFVPKGTLLDLQDRRRKQFKIAVFCALSVGVVGLTTMLGVQGCKREKPAEDTFGLDTGINTNIALNVIEPTNTPPASTNPVVYYPPVEPTNVVPNNPLPVEPLPLAGGSKYKIVKGDTLAVIAKKNGVSLKALEAANPKLDPKHLKIGTEVTIPAATPKGVSPSAPGAAAMDGNSYTVKPGDTLGKIAKAHGTTVAAIKAANNLTTDRINVGKKLILPSKAEAAPMVPAATPVVEPVVTPPPAPSTNLFH
jgi:LysM repeat protein